MTARLPLNGALVYLAILGGSLLLGLLAVVEPVLALAAVLGLAFLLLVMADLTIGVCLFGFVAFLEVLPALGGVSFAKAIGAILAVSWLATIATRREERRDFFGAHAGITALAALFLAWVAASAVWAEDPSESTNSLMRFALNIFLLPIVFTAMRTRNDVRALMGVFVVAALISAFYGSVIAPGDVEAAEAGRLSGAGVDPNYLAIALTGSLALALAFVGSRDDNALLRWGALAAAGLSVLAILLTASRTGLVALAAAVLTAVVVAGPRRRAPIALLALALAGVAVFYFAALAPEQAREHVAGYQTGTGRTDIWTVGWRMVEAEPVHGVGAGNFPVSSIHYLLEPGSIIRDDFIVDDPKVAHNIYLDTLAELGIVGLVLFVGIVGSCVLAALRAARIFTRLGDRTMDLLARGTVAGTVGMFSGAFFNSVQYNKPLWLMLALGPCLLAVARRQARDSGTPAT